MARITNTEGTEALSLDNMQAGEELIERTSLDDNSQIVILTGNKDKGYFATIGKYRLTDIYPNAQDVIDFINGNQWDFITRLIATMIEADKKLSTDQKK